VNIALNGWKMKITGTMLSLLSKDSFEVTYFEIAEIKL
jgi:hypothetical protein